MHFPFGPCSCNCQRPKRPPGVASNVCCGWVLWMPEEWLEKRKETKKKRNRLLWLLTYFHPFWKAPKCHLTVAQVNVTMQPAHARSFPSYLPRWRTTGRKVHLLILQDASLNTGVGLFSWVSHSKNTGSGNRGKSRARLKMHSGRYSPPLW